MLGPAELREIAEALNAENDQTPPAADRSPYLTTQFAVGMAVTRAAAAGLKTPLMMRALKR